jgi:hypothetical protein
MTEFKVSEENAVKIIAVTHPRVTFVGGVYGSGKKRFSDNFKARGSFNVHRISKGSTPLESKSAVSKILKASPPHVSIVIAGDVSSPEDLSEIFAGDAELFTFVFLYINNPKRYYEKIKSKPSLPRDDVSAKEFAKLSISASKSSYEKFKESFDVLTVLSES